MKTIYKNQFVEVFFDEKNALLIDVWTQKTENLSKEGFKELLLDWKNLAEDHKIRFALTNLKAFALPMTPELQDWTVENITKPLCEKGYYTRHAFVMPEEFIAQLAIEQFAEETDTNASPTRYFGDEEEAKSWVLDGKLESITK
ncbi:hypothetical protein [Flexithrix dorotheae]|uniref:hypothetical protein n=1 Tax=Flexithrix dorotheae TaxID=70993 RepID=UPI0003813C57|nr:hypothetical protein [Flexithrix dorotheae]